MARRLDWEKAARLERAARARPARSLSKKQMEKRRQALIGFALKHNLGCFKCGAKDAEWAESGISLRGPWIVCVPCVQDKRPAARPA